MSKTKTGKKGSRKVSRKDRVAEVANTFEWLITAFILAFVFRSFIMEAFRIPTGSMADTLMGANFRLRCQQCGYKYDHGFVPQNYRLPPDTVPRGNVHPPRTRCPSCGYYQLTNSAMPISYGDRILVLKCIYQFSEPKQWDVVVFKNPLEPAVNYIKRLVGRPGETVEIIDGDIYIDGQISRKPSKVQNELWMPIYDNDYQPVRPREGSFNGHIWQQPFRNAAGSKWIIEKDNPTVFCLYCSENEINSLIYDTSIGNDFRASYAYNDVREYNYMPYCSDLMVRLYVNPAESSGRVGMALGKYQTDYRAWVDFAGNMVIEVMKDGKTVELARRSIEPAIVNRPSLVKLANVDHQLIFQFGSEKLVYDLGRLPGDAGPRETNIQPVVEIFGSGKLKLSHVAIFRDIHYTSAKFANSISSGRAVEGNSFTLKEDEFFMLGDNSPNSEDCRWWSRKGVGNNRSFYREGIVPRDYLVGKALCVYWPNGFKLSGKSGFALIPNIGQMRLIYGGSNKNQ